MRTTIRTLLVLGLVLVLLVMALPVLGSTGEGDSVTVVNEDFLVPAGTPEQVYASYVADAAKVVPTSGRGAAINIAD